MQHVYTAQQQVLEYSELRDKVVAKINVSHKGYAAMKHMLTFQKGMLTTLCSTLTPRLQLLGLHILRSLHCVLAFATQRPRMLGLALD